MHEDSRQRRFDGATLRLLSVTSTLIVYVKRGDEIKVKDGLPYHVN